MVTNLEENDCDGMYPAAQFTCNSFTDGRGKGTHPIVQREVVFDDEQEAHVALTVSQVREIEMNKLIWYCCMKREGVRPGNILSQFRHDTVSAVGDEGICVFVKGQPGVLTIQRIVR